MEINKEKIIQLDGNQLLTSYGRVFQLQLVNFRSWHWVDITPELIQEPEKE